MGKEARGGKLRTGGHLVVDALLAHGAKRVFGVPGESYCLFSMRYSMLPDGSTWSPAGTSTAPR